MNLNSNKKEDSSSNSINLVGDSTRIKGEVHTETDIRIDGTVDGDVYTKSKLVFGEDATITGNLYCHSADLSGTINGNIYCKELLHLKSSSHVKGDIFTKRLVIEKDAYFNGQCEMKDQINFPQEKNIAQESEKAGSEKSKGEQPGTGGKEEKSRKT